MKDIKLEYNKHAKEAAYICVLEEWTTTPPTEEGFYWIDGIMRRGEWVFYCVPSGWWDERNNGYEPYKEGLRFLGPLPIPEPPTLAR